MSTWAGGSVRLVSLESVRYGFREVGRGVFLGEEGERGGWCCSDLSIRRGCTSTSETYVFRHTCASTFYTGSL